MGEWVLEVRGISDHLCVVVSETLKCFTQNLFHPWGGGEGVGTVVTVNKVSENFQEKLGSPDSPIVKSQIISDPSFFKSSSW